MLVLTRKLNEAIKIGDNIEVKVIAVDGDQVKLGIDAPPQSIEVHRKEIYEAIQQENNEAANISTNLFDLIKKSDKKY
ncbi:carbon storage regulator [Gracilibacillus boraciitolerans JCM 21714]|uniref:Translational regulator CsrA n=1 Tax=Gracilibacillus boraciitolerans JCM 21714 TaxID=1298598 RepID=W4VQL1_9BACI|nr:carbon storage regulator CsrA [Gracilibacillus boraciitolerans]GAE95059.1 carbon storage regulator [Gracilibacillus boraciitolerans JCM 21714]